MDRESRNDRLALEIFQETATPSPFARFESLQVVTLGQLAPMLLHENFYLKVIEILPARQKAPAQRFTLSFGADQLHEIKGLGDVSLSFTEAATAPLGPCQSRIDRHLRCCLVAGMQTRQSLSLGLGSGLKAVHGA